MPSPGHTGDGFLFVQNLQGKLSMQLSTAELAALNAGKPVTITPPAIVTAPNPTPTPTPKPTTGTAPALKVICAQNGAVNSAWVEDYSYSATDALADKTDGGNGNAACVKVTTTGPWGAFQPSNYPGKSTDFSACTRLTVDIKAPKGNTYAMFFLKGGDTPINSAGFLFTKTTDGWETFSCPKSEVMVDGSTDVSASIYKGDIQSKQGTAGDVFLIDNWGGI